MGITSCAAIRRMDSLLNAKCFNSRLYFQRFHALIEVNDIDVMLPVVHFIRQVLHAYLVPTAA